MTFTLPKLPYDYSALEPHIDTKTMAIHHDKHHQGYVNNLNAALENYPDLHHPLWQQNDRHQHQNAPDVSTWQKSCHLAQPHLEIHHPKYGRYLIRGQF